MVAGARSLERALLRARLFPGIQGWLRTEQGAVVGAPKHTEQGAWSRRVGLGDVAPQQHDDAGPSRPCQHPIHEWLVPSQPWRRLRGLAPVLTHARWFATSADRHGSRATHASPTSVLSSLQARSAPRIGAQLITTNLLQDFVEHPTLQTWDVFSELLNVQVPARMLTLRQQIQNIMQRLQAAHPQTDVSALATVVDSICARLQTESHVFVEFCMAPRCPVPPPGTKQAVPPPDAQPLTGEAARLAGCTDFAEPSLAFAVAQASHHAKLWVNSEFDKIVADFRLLTEKPGWWDQDPDVLATLDTVMDSVTMFTLSMRVLLSEALCCWGRLRRAHGLPGMGFSHDSDLPEGRHADRWSMAGPRGPPGYDDDSNREPPSLILPDAPVVELLTLATEDTRAFCIEKNSTAPEVQIVGDPSLRVVCIDSYVQHVYGEVMKNAMQALIKRYGAWDVDEAKPIQVRIELSPIPIAQCGATQPPTITPPTAHHGRGGAGSPSAPLPSSTHHLCISVTDTGGGLSAAQLATCRHWFSTTNTRQRVGYGYSRDHGAQFAGLGVGMPLSRVYARLMGGKIEWEVNRAKGTTCARLCLPCHGFAF